MNLTMLMMVAADEPISPLSALLLGVVEGLTEYLPVSSTGHLILVSRLLGQKDAGADAFDIVIQLGAILAVLVHYRRLLFERARGLGRGDAQSKQLLLGLILGFVPTAITGLLLRKAIKQLLFHPIPIAIALLLGGLVMILMESIYSRRAKQVGAENAIGLVGLEHVTLKRAFIIGLGQCISMWPGSSRSMCTIVTGRLTGLSTQTAAEFSFLLGLPTLGAATVYEALKSRHELATVGAASIFIGLAVSFLVAWAVIAAFLAYLKKYGLAPFGVYRIIVAVLVVVYVA